MNIGTRIKNLRNKAGMSQVGLADAIGVSKQTLYKYENNIITNIPTDKIQAIAKVCNTTPSYIMGWDSFDYVAEEDRDIAKWALKNNLAPIELPEKIQALNVLLHQYKYDIVAREGGEYNISYDFAEGASGIAPISDEEISEIIDSTSKHLELVTYNVVRRILDRYNNSNIDINYPEQKDLP